MVGESTFLVASFVSSQSFKTCYLGVLSKYSLSLSNIVIVYLLYALIVNYSHMPERQMRFLAKIALKLFLLLQNATYWYSLHIQVFRCLYRKQLPIQNYINRILLLHQSKLFYLLLSLCFVFTVPCGLQQYIYI